MTGRIRLLVSEAWSSLGSNLSTTVAALVTVLIGMFLLGLFIALGTWTISWTDHVKRELQVRVDMKQDATIGQKNAVAHLLQQNAYVKKGGVDYVPKAEGLAEMKKKYPVLVQNLAENPLPDEFRVTPDSPDNVNRLYDSILQSKPPGVLKVVRGKKATNTILDFARTIEVIFVIATVILVAASILLISNTIRLSIYSRRREVEVMKLVGATNWFVRGPFMLEGLITGFAGALLAVLLLVIARVALLPHMRWANAGPDVHALEPVLVALILVGMGLTLGAVGSGLTIRRFLRV